MRITVRHVVCAALLHVAIASFAHPSFAREPVGKPRVTPLLQSEKTILGQTFAYPRTGQAKVTAVRITMLPGQSTGWHTHDVPLFAMILEGELVVDYGPRGRRTYRAGDSFMEAMGSAHDGYNLTERPVVLIAVFMGAEGAANSAPTPAP